jgi:hypothetical protein
MLQAFSVISAGYQNCISDNIENGGHNFKTDLSNEEKQALKAFMVTL